MGRPHKDVVVVIAMDADGHVVREDIVPRQSFEDAGSILLNSEAVRRKDGIRTISIRVFNDSGGRLDVQMRFFGSDGAHVEALHRRADGTIIDAQS